MDRLTIQTTDDRHDSANRDIRVHPGIRINLYHEISNLEATLRHPYDRAAKLYISRAIFGDQGTNLIAATLGDLLHDRCLIAGERDPHLLSDTLDPIEWIAGQGSRRRSDSPAAGDHHREQGCRQNKAHAQGQPQEASPSGGADISGAVQEGAARGDLGTGRRHKGERR